MTGQSPRAILVLGMHRSGTSAATRVLNLLGAGLGTRMMPPMAGSNEKGFWENLDAVDIDDRLLTGIGRSWHDVRDMPDGWLDSVAASDAYAAITRFIQVEFTTSPLWAVKDPRMCRLAPLWLRVLADCGIPPGILFLVRHPLEVAASLHARDGWSRARSLLLWMQHTLEAERATRGYPRVIVTYDQVLKDWSASMARVARALGVAWPRSFDEARGEIEAFLDVDARHHEAPSAEADAPADSSILPTLVAEVFQQCAHLSTDDGDGVWRDLQGFADEFHRFSALYGPCIDDFVAYASAAEGRAPRAGTIPGPTLPEPSTLGQQSKQVGRALIALASEGGDLEAVKQCLGQQAGLVERLSGAVERQWARIASLEALLFAEHQSLRAVLAGESYSVKSALAGQSQAIKSALADESQTVRSELAEKSLSVSQELERLARLLAGQADAIRGLEYELAEVRRGHILPTLRRWLRR